MKVTLVGGPQDGVEMEIAPSMRRIEIPHWAVTDPVFVSFGEIQIHLYDRSGNYIGER